MQTVVLLVLYKCGFVALVFFKKGKAKAGVAKLGQRGNISQL